MNYFLDTEFNEGHKQHRFLGLPVGKPCPTIDLISIGIVCEDGRELSLLNRDCDLSAAWNKKDAEGTYWLRENVLRKIYREHINGDMLLHFDFSLSTMRYIFGHHGDHKPELVQQIMEFLHFYQWELPGIGGTGQYRHNLKEEDLPVFYGYYADYDWVVFAQLFGSMMNLPKGMPMYCLDIMQDLRRIGLDKKLLKKYVPTPAEEHSAIADARWNRDAHNFLGKFWDLMDEEDRARHSKNMADRELAEHGKRTRA